MTKLASMKCDVCRVGAPLVTDAEIAEFMPQLPTWCRVDREGVNQLERSFPFADFVEALAFTNRVGDLAEEHGHHPAILTEWGKVTVTWWTHKIGGLHKNDFIMASRTDHLIS
jgi:4a-hydroxytetrahydrobiopterin dehydratase